MKKILLSILTICCVANFALAQSKISEGEMTYSMKLESDDLPPEAAAMMPEEMKIFFTKDFSRSEMTMGMGQIVVIADNKAKKSTTLMDMMGQKMKLEIGEKEAKEKADKQKVEVVPTNETKVIQGYTCKKVIINITTETGEKLTNNAYYSEDVQFNSSQVLNNKGYESIKGALMEFEMNMNGIQMKMICTNVTAKGIDKKLFAIPEGYKPMDMNKLMGGE